MTLLLTMVNCVVFIFVASVGSFPATWIQKITENNRFDDFDNYLPKTGDFPKHEYSTDDKLKPEEITFKHHSLEANEKNNREAKTMKELVTFVKEAIKTINSSKSETTTPENALTTTDQITTTEEFTTQLSNDFTTILNKLNIYPTIMEIGNVTNHTYRFPRQKDTETSEEFEGGGRDKESQEDSDEDGNMITGIISAFLGGLSRPDGSIDVDAITGLLGSLSTQNPDGTYDFSGLTELLMSFFGGGDDGGGSNFGAFLGGIVGAFLKGVAQPPGAKGVGIFTGNLLTQLLPALSGPAPAMEDSTKPPPQGLDSGSFILGLLKPLLQSSAGGSIGPASISSSSGSGGGGGGSKFTLIKALISMITGIFTSSSASSSSKKY